MIRYSSIPARLTVLLLSFMVFLPNKSSAGNSATLASDGIYDLIMERVRESHLNVNVPELENSVSNSLLILQEDGSFSDIDYTNRAQTAWTPLAHLDRLGDMVIAYLKDSNKYHADDKLYTGIVSSLNFWYDNHPVSTNWYMQQIACPQRMGVILILMRAGNKKLPADLETKLIERMEKEGNRPDQSTSFGTAANKMDIATHWLYRGCLLKDRSIVSFAVEQCFYPLHLTTGEGLQYDYSYQQHGSQLYIGGYGYVLAEGISKVAVYLRDTPYALPDEKVNYLGTFLTKAYLPVIRGQYFLYNVMGRGMTRVGSLKQTSFIPVLKNMILLDPVNRIAYENAIHRLDGSEPANYGLTAFNTHFWRSDYTLHQRPAYTFDVRMASTYTCRNENGNGEGLHGYFLTDGATTIVRDGDEYYNIFPVWDWTHIPGVTSPVMSDIPRPNAWQTSGSGTFAGGVSDGIYAVSAYMLNDTAYHVNTSAKKSWFLFDDEIICLGSGINSEAKERINTTVNQCLLKSDIIVNQNGEISTLGRGADVTTDRLLWVLHDKVAYYFPEKSNVTLTSRTQAGSWHFINSSLSADPVEKDVFKLCIDHGVNPANEKYAYYILSDIKSISEMESYDYSHISVLDNTDKVQAVTNKKLDITGFVFYEPATYINGDLQIIADRACVLMIKGIDEKHPELYIADPSRKESVINLEIKIKGKVINQSCTFPVYPEPYAGSTLKYTL